MKTYVCVPRCPVPSRSMTGAGSAAFGGVEASGTGAVAGAVAGVAATGAGAVYESEQRTRAKQRQGEIQLL